MKKKFLIKDLLANAYYWAYQLGTGFSEDASEATLFDDREAAEKRIAEEIAQRAERARMLQIIDVYVVGE